MLISILNFVIFFSLLPYFIFFYSDKLSKAVINDQNTSQLRADEYRKKIDKFSSKK